MLLNADVNAGINTPAGSTVTVVGSVDFNGAVAGAGGFYGPGTSNFNALYDPGDSPATVPFEGSVQLGPQNSLAIEIGGTAPGAFDQLAIDGTALLDGSLDVSLVDLGSGTYQPQSGDSFAIVSAASGLSGTFAGLNLPSLGGGLGWEVNPIGNTLFLDVVGGVLAGDFNNDGNLDGADIDSLVANVAAMTGDLAFDLTGDGALNEADLAEWLVLGGAENLASGNPYLSGDANLDGTVDGQDFLAWNNSKFSHRGGLDGRATSTPMAWSTVRISSAGTTTNSPRRMPVV